MNDKFDAMLNLVNKYLHETWGVGLYDYELRDLIELQRDHTTAKIAAIKYVREATKRSDHELFKLDLRKNSDIQLVTVGDSNAEDAYSDFTAWATTNNMDLATGEVQVQYLGLKKAKDLVEFIQLNLDKIAG
jgi:hypothetical protein